MFIRRFDGGSWVRKTVILAAPSGGLEPAVLPITAAAGGKVDYTLTCAVGAYTYAGQPATLSVKHSLVCDAGSYIYTGQAATLQVRHSLICDAGAYAYTGLAATLQVGHGLVCNTGVYVYSGIDATLDVVVASAPTVDGGIADIRKRAEKEAIEREEMEILEFIMIINAENYCNEHRMTGD